MVKMHRSISQSTIWRTGIVLEYKVDNEKLNEALIKADLSTGRIIIAIRGNENTRRDFLSKIRDKFGEIHDSFPEEFKENFAEKIPIPGHPGFVVPYKHLLNLEKIGREFVLPEGLTDEFRIKDLLNGIESIERRREREDNTTESDALIVQKKNLSDRKAELEPTKQI